MIAIIAMTVALAATQPPPTLLPQPTIYISGHNLGPVPRVLPKLCSEYVAVSRPSHCASRPVVHALKVKPKAVKVHTSTTKHVVPSPPHSKAVK